MTEACSCATATTTACGGCRQVTTVAGYGQASFADGEGDAASFHCPIDIEVVSQSLIYIADAINCCIRTVQPADGTVSTLCGVLRPHGWAGMVAGEMAKAADYFQAGELYERCVEQFKGGLRVGNVVERRVQAHDSGVEALVEAAMDFLQANALSFQISDCGDVTCLHFCAEKGHTSEAQTSTCETWPVSKSDRWKHYSAVATRAF